MMSRILSGAALVLPFVCVAQAAQDLPKRKPGLWEIQTQMKGLPAIAGPIQMCADEKSDNLLQSQAQNQAESVQSKCGATDWKKEGDRITVNSVCKMDATTTTTTAVFTGSFESNYRGDIRVAYDPPISGLKQTEMAISAKWLGPCKPGQKPGDIVMQGVGAPGGMKKALNMEKLMKIQEQMKGMRME